MTLSLIQRLALVTFLSDALGKLRSEELKAQSARELEPGERLAAKFGGRLAGWVSMPQPATRASVTDHAKFLAWCEEYHASEVETVRQVRSSFAEVVRRQVKQHGGLIDKRTGEITPVPGVEAAEGEPAVRVELGEHAAAVIGAAWADGDISLGEVLALPSPGGEASGAA